MTNDAINNWIEQAKQPKGNFVVGNNPNAQRPQVIKRVETDQRGKLIMLIADAIRPVLAKFLDGKRDHSGLPFQPAHVRGIALNIAQGMVKQQDTNTATA